MTEDNECTPPPSPEDNARITSAHETAKADDLALARFLRFVGYDRTDPLAIRFEFATDRERIEAADEIDILLSNAFTAARARMAAALAQAREKRGGKPIKASVAKPGWADNGICRQHGVYLCSDCAVEATPGAASPKPTTWTITDEDRADLMADEYCEAHHDDLTRSEQVRWITYREGALAGLKAEKEAIR